MSCMGYVLALNFSIFVHSPYWQLPFFSNQTYVPGMRLVVLNHLCAGRQYVCVFAPRLLITVPLDLNFTYACTQKAATRKIHGNAPE